MLIHPKIVRKEKGTERNCRGRPDERRVDAPLLLILGLTVVDLRVVSLIANSTSSSSIRYSSVRGESLPSSSWVGAHRALKRQRWAIDNSRGGGDWETGCPVSNGIDGESP
jgi:hypothetical protein